MSGSYFVDPHARHRIALREFDGSEHWVDIAAECSEADWKVMNQSQAAVQFDAAGVAVGAHITADRQYEAILARAIRAWSLPGRDGGTMAVSLTAFRLLGPVGGWLAERIYAHYAAQRRPEPEKNA